MVEQSTHSEGPRVTPFGLWKEGESMPDRENFVVSKRGGV